MVSKAFMIFAKEIFSFKFIKFSSHKSFTNKLVSGALKSPTCNIKALEASQYGPVASCILLFTPKCGYT